MFKDLVLKNRSYRRFYADVRMSDDELTGLIDLARNSASTVNSQALKYIIVNDDEKKNEVFESLAWAGLLKDWSGPSESERPSAYIIILCDGTIGKNKQWDEGIAAQTILLGATEMGYGGCMLGSIDKNRISRCFDIDTDRYSVDLIVALGKPKERVKLVETDGSGSTAYYRDTDDTHCVPKRKLSDIILR
ncbi:MAG: nitroreductase family protein [Clostridia bacterium]|nr:nitroreductase family protein [Clostridia bacterium]